MNLPKVSIITPSLNQGEFIEETILSVLNQNYPNIEYIVIDGGSTDNTLKILRKYNNRLTWKSEPDKGQSNAINKGFRLSTGEILAWLNSDDTSEIDAVKTAVEFLTTHQDVGMVYGQCNLINEKGQKVGEFVDKLDFDYYLLTNKALNFIPQQTVFFRRKAIQEIGFLDISLHRAMDYDYWIRIAKKFKIAYIPKVLANFRIHSAAKSAHWESFWPEILSILLKHCGTRPLFWYFKRYYRTAKANGLSISEARKLFERFVNGSKYFDRYRTLLQRKSLSRACIELAKEHYLTHRKGFGITFLSRTFRADPSIITYREFIILFLKFILGIRLSQRLRRVWFLQRKFL